MLSRLKRFRRRRRLKALVGLLPHVLKLRYGGSEFYTAGQVRRACSAMQLAKEVIPYAFAVGCARGDFHAAAEAGTRNYDALRAELAELFAIDDPNFTTNTLRAVRFSGVENVSNYEYAASV